MRSDLPEIYFHYPSGSFYFPQRAALKQFLNKLFKAEGKRVETINYIFCDDAYLLGLNQTYLQHDTLTDIITFELSPAGAALTADIFISVERVRENARLFHIPFQKEILRVVFHGALHLCGYKDKTAAETRLMRQREDHYLQKWSVPRGTLK